MARITVEDCLDKVDNRFELVLLATKRARQLVNGSEATLEWENDKPTVMALREMAAQTVDVAILRKNQEVKNDALTEEQMAKSLDIELEKPMPMPSGFLDI